jgi:hypothetical protein
MKTIPFSVLGLFFSSAVLADDCEAAIDNLSRWSGVTQEASQRETSLTDCHRDIAAGDQEALISAQCLALPAMGDAVLCLSDALLDLSLAQCVAQSSVTLQTECYEATQEMFTRLPAQIEATILSGQPQDISASTEVLTLPPRPVRAGSCAELMTNLKAWSSQTRTTEEWTRATEKCETDLRTQSETAVVVLCLSFPDLDAASDCMVTEAIRANMGECTRASPVEQTQCEQMLLGMLEPMKAEMQSMIQDGSLLE